MKGERAREGWGEILGWSESDGPRSLFPLQPFLDDDVIIHIKTHTAKENCV